MCFRGEEWLEADICLCVYSMYVVFMLTFFNAIYQDIDIYISRYSKLEQIHLQSVYTDKKKQMGIFWLMQMLENYAVQDTLTHRCSLKSNIARKQSCSLICNVTHNDPIHPETLKE